MPAAAAGPAQPCLGLRLRRGPHTQGRKFRTLNVVDEFSRECLAIRVGRKLRSTEVIDVLTDLFISRGIVSRLARRGIETSQKLGRHRWIIERTFAWINRFRRLVTRYERRSDMHHAFTALACSLICFSKLQARF